MMAFVVGFKSLLVVEWPGQLALLALILILIDWMMERVNRG